MKMIASLLAGLFIVFGSSIVNAQTDTKAKAILAGVSKKYKSYDVVKANFTFTMDNPQAKIKETEQGSLIIRAKANKYRVNTKGQELISDGKSQWTYLKEENEVQVTDIDQSNDALNPAKIFSLYETGYKYAYTGDSKAAGKVYQMIDLSPLDTKKPYFKIRLSIDKIEKQISNVLIFDKNGNKYGYSVSSLTAGKNIPESTFVFDAKKYPGVEVVDLR